MEAPESLRRQGFPKEKASTRQYEILQNFIDGVRNKAPNRNLTLMYAHSSTEKIHLQEITVEQYLRMRGSERNDRFNKAQAQRQRQHSLTALNQVPHPKVHVMADCQLEDRTRKLLQQPVISSQTNSTGG